MIGKKSKFEEHEKQLKVQNKQNSKTRSSPNLSKGKGKTRGSSIESQDTDELLGEQNNTDELRDVAEKLTNRQVTGLEETVEEVSEETIQAERKHSYTRSEGKHFGEDGKIHGDNENSEVGLTKKLEGSPTIIIKNIIKTDTDLLWDEICSGVKGKNSGIPMGFNRLNKYLGLRKSIYTTVGAAAGCGKTSLVDCAYVLNPYDWYIKNKHKASCKLKFEVIYFSMERKKTYKLAKWLCMKMYKEDNVLLTTDQLLSWQTTLDKTNQERAKFYIDYYFKEMMESGIVTIIDGQMNPTGIYKFMKAHALKRGTEEEISEYEHRYIPNDDNLITNVVHDHAGKTKNENIGGKYEKKLSIDKASEYYCWARDYLGYSPIMINQFNRTSYQDIQFTRKEGGDPDPTVEYWKDSGNIIEDCDVAISLFNPYKYSLEEYMGYTVNDFTDTLGNNKFRGLKIIKNSYGTDNLRIGLGFLGEVGLFKELTKSKEISQKEINSVINNDLFLGF